MAGTVNNRALIKIAAEVDSRKRQSRPLLVVSFTCIENPLKWNLSFNRLRSNVPSMVEKLTCGYDQSMTALLQFDCAVKIDQRNSEGYSMSILPVAFRDLAQLARAFTLKE